MNKGGIHRRDVFMYACARVRVSGDDCRFRNKRCGGQRPGDTTGEVWRGLREDVVRDAVVERKKQEVERCTCVVVSLYACIGARYCLCVRASKAMRMQCWCFLPYFGNMSGKDEE